MTDPELRAALMRFAMDPGWSPTRSHAEGFGWVISSEAMGEASSRGFIRAQCRATTEYELTESGLNFIKEE